MDSQKTPQTIIQNEIHINIFLIIPQSVFF